MVVITFTLTIKLLRLRPQRYSNNGTKLWTGVLPIPPFTVLCSLAIKRFHATPAATLTIPLSSAHVLRHLRGLSRENKCCLLSKTQHQLTRWEGRGSCTWDEKFVITLIQPGVVLGVLTAGMCTCVLNAELNTVQLLVRTVRRLHSRQDDYTVTIMRLLHQLTLTNWKLNC